MATALMKNLEVKFSLFGASSEKICALDAAKYYVHQRMRCEMPNKQHARYTRRALSREEPALTSASEMHRRADQFQPQAHSTPTPHPARPGSARPCAFEGSRGTTCRSGEEPAAPSSAHPFASPVLTSCRSPEHPQRVAISHTTQISGRPLSLTMAREIMQTKVPPLD